MTALAPAQLEELRADLDTLVALLAAMVEQTRGGAKPVALDQPIGRLSRMDAIQQQHMTGAALAAAQRRLAQARGALRRLEEDVYGECQSCGEDVGYPRLKAAPETPFCVECQGRREGDR
jgi:DnaK suppressor protein